MDASKHNNRSYVNVFSRTGPEGYPAGVRLFVLFLMTILTQSFLSFMGCNFMSLPFFTTRHR